MNNPFRKRATEFLRDEEAFLAVVSPEPVTYFLGEHGRAGSLYDRLVIVRGTPGSGKTTLARLFEYPAVAALLRNSSSDTYRPLVGALTAVGAVADDQPKVVACRLPLETDYRDFWEFPYADDLKTGLMTALIQARAVLGWLRNLTSAGTGISIECIHIVPRADAEAAANAIGGTGGPALLEKARSVEASLYRTMSALVAPPVEQLGHEATSAYRPFDVIEAIEVEAEIGGNRHSLRLLPLAILDDAHILHPAQFQSLQRWLVRRELRVARWMLTRLDVLHPGEALAVVSDDRSQKTELPGINAQRETTEILLQSGAKDRYEHRRTFRRMAKDMAARYLDLMTMFRDRRLKRLEDLLSDDPEPITPAKRRELEASVEAAKRECRVSDARYQALRALVSGYKNGGRPVADDVGLAMLRVLIHRYSKRIKKTPGLFGDEEDPEPSEPLTADVKVFDAACIYLLHRFDRPFYFGIDDLCDASSENAEQFLRLAAELVDQSSAQLIRQKKAALTARIQNRLLRDAATDILKTWNFPHSEAVRRLADDMANRCRDVTLESNAKLGAGANAFGIPQAEFDVISEQHPDLARVLQYGVAYNAFTIVPHHDCKNKEWCLVELGGILILHHGLTLKRGGFIESTSAELAGMGLERAK